MSRPLVAALLALAALIAVIAAALGFEHIGGYLPCKLCLAQRTPYYVAIPLAALGALSLGLRGPARLSPALLAAVGAIMLYSAWLGGHHAGVEWGWWPGPTDCAAGAGGVATDVKDLLSDLSTTVPPSCTDAAVRFFGLSFAGMNFLASLAIAAIALAGAWAGRRA